MGRELDILILAAGRGSRMQSDLPKVLHPLMGHPLLQHVLNAARVLEPREIGVIVGHRRDEVQAAVGGSDLSFIVQDEQKGTGHAVRCAASRFAGRSGDVMVLSGDVPLMRSDTLIAFAEAHRDADVPASLITARLETPGSLGRIVRDPASGRVARIVEARDATAEELAIDEINSGIYLFRNEVLFEGLERVQVHQNSGEFYLTDVVKQLTEAQEHVHAEVIADPTEAMGINTRDELGEAELRLRDRLDASGGTLPLA